MTGRPANASPHEVELGGSFPAADRDAWLAEVNRVLLKGRPDATEADAAQAFTRTLVTATEDGFDLQPLYTPADAPETGPAPGDFPYTRGTHAAPRSWEIRQRVWADVDGSSAVAELESGATGLLLDVPGDADADLLEAVLNDVYLDLAPVSLTTPDDDDGISAARAMLDVWDRRGIATDARTGTLGADPIGAWARSGGATDVDAALAATAVLLADCAERAPVARVLVADGTVWHDAGATDAQELAWTLASAAATVRSVVTAGVAPDHAFTSLEFRWAATADQFATICKLRAARRLWARIADVAGAAAESGRMFQHADASRRMLTRYDTWVNSLRSTVACFSAAVGGADAITVSPHDALIERGGSALGRRLARNTQSVLQLESNLARVVDLAGGSWYVERRTAQLASAAWDEIQRAEAEGGLIAAVREGRVGERLTSAVERRDRRLATRAQPITGLSEFPDVAETPPPPTPTATVGRTPTEFEPFTLHRLAEQFERQRGRADAATRETGERPAVFLAALGGPAASTARVTFAKNLFEVAGIRTLIGGPDDFDPSVTTFACLCSSDAIYAERGSQVARQLRAAGAGKVFVAGRKLDLDGVDEEVGTGSDVLDVLTRTLDDMGVPA